MSETLYKRINGKVQIWESKITNDTRHIGIKTSYGELDGKQTIKIKEKVSGVNIGKANETSPSTQALKLIKSSYAKKRKLGYRSLQEIPMPDEVRSMIGITLNLDLVLEKYLIETTTNTEGETLPMYCSNYYKSKKNFIDPTGKHWKDRKYYYISNPYVKKRVDELTVKLPAYIQPKINGLRCKIKLDKEKNKIIFLSKNNLIFNNLHHIQEEFQRNLDIFDRVKDKLRKYYVGVDKVAFNRRVEELEIMFDGELYIPNLPLGEISSAINSFSLTTSSVSFYAFDLAIPGISNDLRFKALKEAFTETFILGHPIVIVKTLHVTCDEQVQAVTDQFIKEGYEGSIIREPKGLYQFGKRPSIIAKLKRTISAEFTIVDVVSQKEDPNLGLFVCVTPEGKQFEVTPTEDMNFKIKILLEKHKYIGKQLTCEFYEYTAENKPYHLISNIVRDYE